MDDINFCPACGKNLPSGSTYCPACGRNMADPGDADRGRTEAERAYNERRVKVSVIILLIFSMIALVSGAALFFFAAEVTDAFFGGLEEIMENGGFAWSAIVSMIEWSGIISMIAGVSGLIAAVLAQKRRMWAVVLALSIFVTLCGSIFCLIAVWKIYKAKSVFTD
ncbi:MAG: zinc ribbon domain-containing protein [Methanomassiliicoccaceae archaeon]|jgi:hypothetical protein|nr:zinc ribbon domain-containing protein [Methanomassiliicoccaceae archaeon]